MGLVGLGDHQEAGGVLVDAVDDAGPDDPANPRKLAAAVVEQGVDQGAIEVPCGGMNNQSGWFVDHDQVFVFEHDAERECPAAWASAGTASGTRIANWVPAAGLKLGCAGRPPVQRDPALAQQGFDPLARQPARFGQGLVEPLAAGQRAGNDAFLPVHC